jgi:hypothetical protein
MEIDDEKVHRKTQGAFLAAVVAELTSVAAVETLWSQSFLLEKLGTITSETSMYFLGGPREGSSSILSLRIPSERSTTTC